MKRSCDASVFSSSANRLFVDLASKVENDPHPEVYFLKIKVGGATTGYVHALISHDQNCINRKILFWQKSIF